jgi:hypothetical protein
MSRFCLPMQSLPTTVASTLLSHDAQIEPNPKTMLPVHNQHVHINESPKKDAEEKKGKRNSRLQELRPFFFVVG